MTAYLISDVQPKDAEAFAVYRERAAASIAAYGGKYLVRGGNCEVLEGSQRSRTIIIVAFPSLDIARRWYRSAEYADALAVRNEALERELILVDGLQDGPGVA